MRYLRKINPYVFEELLLLALERQGLTVVRNASYSGDGGTDGQVIIDDECWLIRAKRYSRAITPTHIRDFDQLLEQRTCCGFHSHRADRTHESGGLLHLSASFYHQWSALAGSACRPT